MALIFLTSRAPTYQGNAPFPSLIGPLHQFLSICLAFYSSFYLCIYIIKYLACLFFSCSMFIISKVDFIGCCWGFQIIFRGSWERWCWSTGACCHGHESKVRRFFFLATLELELMHPCPLTAELQRWDKVRRFNCHPLGIYSQIIDAYFCFHFTLFRGMYVCRTLSYQGAEFEVIEAPLEEEMKVCLISIVALWVINWYTILISYYLNMLDDYLSFPSHSHKICHVHYSNDSTDICLLY